MVTVEAPKVKNRRYGIRDKFNRETATQIIEDLRKGHTRQSAAHRGGLTYQTLSMWLRQGETASRGLHREFYLAVLQAEAIAEQRYADTIEFNAVNRKNWQTAAWWLERRRSKDWGKNALDVNVSFKSLAGILANEYQISEEEATRLLEASAQEVTSQGR